MNLKRMPFYNYKCLSCNSLRGSLRPFTESELDCSCSGKYVYDPTSDNCPHNRLGPERSRWGLRVVRSCLVCGSHLVDPDEWNKLEDRPKIL